MRTLRASVVVLSACLGAAMFSNAATVRTYNNNNVNNNTNNNNRNNNNRNNANTNRNNAQNTAAMQAASAKLQTANNDLSKAQGALDAVARLRSQFESSPEYQAALAAVTSAQAEYDGAANPILEGVHARPDFQATMAQKADLEAQVEKSRAGADGGGSSVIAMSQEAMDAGAAGHKLESDALSADPKISELHGKLVDANAKLDALRKQFDASVAQNAEVVSAKSAVDAAAKALQEAQLAYNQAQQKANTAAANANRTPTTNRANTRRTNKNANPPAAAAAAN